MKILIYTRTTGYRHDSIPAGIAALRGLDGYDADAAEELPDDLAKYAAVVFLSTSGTVLDDAQRDAFRDYMSRGGSWLGIHGASTTEYEWDWFEGIAGARFDGHPEIQTATVTVEDGEHPATAHLGATWRWTDEWYEFRANPRPRVRVLLSVDEASYQGGTMGADHPIAWCHSYGGGRCFYTALGREVAGVASADCAATDRLVLAESAVIGIVLYERMLIALRRLAQEDASARLNGTGQ
jgi:type 1 glutamine amidotransferase